MQQSLAAENRRALFLYSVLQKCEWQQEKRKKTGNSDGDETAQQTLNLPGNGDFSLDWGCFC